MTLNLLSGGIHLEGFKKFVKDILYPACLIFTVIIFFFSLIFETDVLKLTVSSTYSLIGVIRFFLFSLILSWSRKVFDIPKISRAKAHFLHYLIFLGNVTVVFVIMGGMTKFIGAIIVFSLLYLIGTLIEVIIRRLTHKNEKPKQEYKRQFK